MRILISCKVESKLAISDQAEILHDGRTYRFVVGPTGFVEGIEIESPVTNPEAFYSSITLTPGRDSAAKIRISRDGNLMESILSDLQYLEGALSFHQNLRAIHWYKIKHELIFEANDEIHREHIQVTSLGESSPTNAEPVTTITVQSLEVALRHMSRYKHLTAAFLQYKEGQFAFWEQRYIHAFSSFYFVMEGFYANGKSGETTLVTEYSRSKELVKIVSAAFERVRTTSQSFEQEFQRLCEDWNIPDSEKGKFKVLVRIRGEIHHFNLKRRRPVGSMQNHSEVLPFASTMREIAANILDLQIAKCNSTPAI